MSKYRIWDKESDIYTLGVHPDTGKAHYTAEEYIKFFAPWAANPNVKVIVGGGAINGVVFMEYEATVAHFKNIGAILTDSMTDEEVLEAIAAFEDMPPQMQVSAEERIAAALEFQNLLSM